MASHDEAIGATNTQMPHQGYYLVPVLGPVIALWKTRGATSTVSRYHLTGTCS